MNHNDPLGLQMRSDMTPYERGEIQKRTAKEREACRQSAMSPTCVGFVGTLLDDDDPQAVRVNGRRYAGIQPLIYINGVWNDRGNAIETGEMLANYYEAPVDVLWNPTGSKIGDLLQVLAVNKLNQPDSTTRMVTQSLRDHIKLLGPGRRQKVIAHSQGAAILSSAISFLSKAERQCLDVVTYGGAAYTFPDGIGAEMHYVNMLDPVPLLVGKWMTLESDKEYMLFSDFVHINHPMAKYQEHQRWLDWLNSPAGAEKRAKSEELRQEMIKKNWSKR